jgi:hypothetical protein
MFSEPLQKVRRLLRISTHLAHWHVQQVERIVRAVRNSRSSSALFFNQSDLAGTPKSMGEMYCNHGPAKTRADDRHIGIAVRSRVNSMILCHESDFGRKIKVDLTNHSRPPQVAMNIFRPNAVFVYYISSG